MSNTSIRPIPTLKGMFSVPRVTQSRDFLKENKKSLRSLEKATTEKLAAKEPVRPKWMPPLRRTASEASERESKRSDSQCMSASRQHINETSLLRSQNTRSQHSINMSESSDNHCAPSVKRESTKQKQMHQARSLDMSESYDKHYAPSERREPPKQKQERQVSQLSESTSSRCQSCGTTRSSTSIGIQTEEIMDEIYLSNALRRCNFDSKTVLSEAGDVDDNFGGYSQYNDEASLSGRSKDLAPTKSRQLNIDDNEAMPMPEINSYNTDDDEAPLSARSRYTLASVGSNATTKSKRRDYKLGSRDDLRLPRYLEKEKREKAEAKERIEARDPDCPRGHVLLSEEERMTSLNTAKQRFDQLIKELNHMPMTAMTLRVRNRKAEIDKELTAVEDEIRIYSKSKVYVRVDNSRNL